MNPSVIIGNITNLERHLLQIKGNEKGIYFDSHFRETPASLSILQEKQKELVLRQNQHPTIAPHGESGAAVARGTS